MWRAMSVLAAFTFLGICACECKTHREAPVAASEKPIRHLGMDDPMPKFDAYFEWTEPEDPTLRDPEYTLYLWQGKEVGGGLRGFMRILVNIASLPERSVILFPSFRAFQPMRYLMSRLTCPSRINQLVL